MTVVDNGRAAIVTGASRGIGAAVAEQLSADGFGVAINYSAGKAAAEALADRITAVGGRAVAAMFKAAEARFGGIDVPVNNAGLLKLSPLAATDDAMFDQLVAVNLKGVFNGLREASRRLRDGGRIVSLSSSVVGLYQPNYGIYAATKAAIEALTRVLAKELGGRGITVNAIAPGPTSTELFLKDKTPELIRRIEEINPLGRLGTVDDIAKVVSFLVAPDGGWVNGQVLRANGGVV